MNSIPIDPFSFILGASLVLGIIWANHGKPWSDLFDFDGDEQ